MGVHPWVTKIPWRRKWQLISVFLPRESHKQRSLVGYSPWGHKELDMTLHTCKPRYPPKLSGRALVSMDLKDHRTMSHCVANYLFLQMWKNESMGS